jgi:phosphoribosylglycinamide formyltransferase-1
MTIRKIAILSSGNGSNTENICNYFNGSTRLRVVLIASNNKNSFVLERAKKLKVPSFIFSKDEMNNYDFLEKKLFSLGVDFIVLSGFLLKVPEKIINLYSNKIINIHPSLLPKFGGEGMFGENVHRSVIESGEKESGITIHYVNNNYDEGNVILQKKCLVSKKETVKSLSEKIQKLEHEFFPKTIEKIVLQ